MSAGHHLEEGVLEGRLLGNLLAELLVSAKQNFLQDKIR